MTQIAHTNFPQSLPGIDQLIRDHDLRGKVVLVRVDLNVDDGDLEHDKTSRLAKPYVTIKKLHDQRAHIILISHRGRPQLPLQAGQNGSTHTLSLGKFSSYLTKLWQLPVHFLPQIPGSLSEYSHLFKRNDAIFLLENLRFAAGEKENTATFAKSMGADADFFVNEAFSVAHRPQASVQQLPKLLPTYYGDNFLQTWQHARSWRQKLQQKPTMVILGGNKTEDKLAFLQHLVTYDNVSFLLGGTLAYLWQTPVRRNWKFIRDMDQRRFIVPQQAVVAQQSNKTSILDYGNLDTITAEDILGWRYSLSQTSTITLINTAEQLLWFGPLCRYDMGCHDDELLIREMQNIRPQPFREIVCAGGNTVAAIKPYKLFGTNISYIPSGNVYLQVLLNLAIPALPS